MKKFYVLDTNVILTEPDAIYNFEDNSVIIPMVVIEEIDKFKKDVGQLGFIARKFSREIDKLRQKGDLLEGVSINDGGSIRIVQIEKENFKKYDVDLNINDNIILCTACYIRDTVKEKVVLVSRDTNVRIKADVLKLNSENYKNDLIEISNIKKGYRIISVDSEYIDNLHSVDKMQLNTELVLDPYPNEYIIFQSNTNKQSCIVRISKEGDEYFTNKVKDYKKQKVSGIKPRNIEQIITMDLLFNRDIKLVSLVGTAGSGKTLLSLAVMLDEVIKGGAYNKMAVARPIIPMGKEIGFLPGTMEEKLKPWVQPIIDNLEFILMSTSFEFKNIGELMESELIQVEALMYMRGRSIPNQFILIDEAQNLSAFEIKTIISRVGEGTKIILTGDPYQIDNPYLTKDTNGLVYAVNKLLESEITGHVVLEKCERSELAELAVNKL